ASPRPNTPANTASNTAIWDGSETNTAQAVQYSRVRDTGRTSASARANRAARSTPVSIPASRSRRPNVAASAGVSSHTVSSRKASLIAAHQRRQACRPDDVLILVVFQDGSERPLECRLVEPLHPEHAERMQPVDRLGDAGWLLNVCIAHPGNGVGDLDS